MLSLVAKFLTSPSRFQSEPDPVTTFANSGWSRAASPDELIAAHLAQSFATEYDGWALSGDVSLLDKFRFRSARLKFDYRHRWEIDRHIVLSNVSRDLILRYAIERAARDNDGCGPWLYRGGKVEFQDVLLDAETSLKLINTWLTVSSRVKTAKEAAAKALADMEANEKKWNLAETLLGMKRNETGALVPVEKQLPAPAATSPQNHVKVTGPSNSEPPSVFDVVLSA